MIGALISAGLGVGSSIFGGIMAARAAKKAKRNVERAQQENENWYARRYNEDGTQRADAQRVLTRMSDQVRDLNRNAAGAAAVAGASDESVALAKQQGADAMADATSRIAAQADARKDNIEEQYHQTKAQLRDQMNQIENSRATAVAQATAGAVKAAGNLGLAVDDYRDARAYSSADKPSSVAGASGGNSSLASNLDVSNAQDGGYVEPQQLEGDGWLDKVYYS